MLWLWPCKGRRCVGALCLFDVPGQQQKTALRWRRGAAQDAACERIGGAAANSKTHGGRRGCRFPGGCAGARCQRRAHMADYPVFVMHGRPANSRTRTSSEALAFPTGLWSYARSSTFAAKLTASSAEDLFALLAAVPNSSRTRSRALCGCAHCASQAGQGRGRAGRDGSMGDAGFSGVGSSGVGDREAAYCT